MRLQLPLMCVPSVGVSVLWPLQRDRAFDRIQWNRYTPEIHQIQKPKFLGTNSNQIKISIEFLNFGEFRRNSIFSGKCNLLLLQHLVCALCVHVRACVCVCVFESAFFRVCLHVRVCVWFAGISLFWKIWYPPWRASPWAPWTEFAPATHKNKFLNVCSIVIAYSKFSSRLTFENFSSLSVLDQIGCCQNFSKVTLLLQFLLENTTELTFETFWRAFS